MMKKLYYFFLLLLLWGLGGLSSVYAQSVALIGENFDTGAVTFTVNLSAATPTWVFVEYTTNPHNPASMSRATFTEVSAGTLAADNRGFRLENSATVTAKLKDVSGMFSWCAYAISAPPRAKVNPGGGYTLHGTPPFTVNGAVLDEGVTNFGPGTCIESFTDFTYNPDGFLFDPPMTVTATAPATVCAGAVTFMATAGGGTTTAMTYTWSIAGAEATTPDNPHITALATTGDDAYSTYTYTVFVTNANGCTSTVSEAGTLTVYAVPVVEDVSSATICSGLTAALSATASHVTDPATYTWNIEGYSETWTTTNTYTTPALTATATANLTYTVQIINSTGCMSEAAVGTVTVNPLPAPVFVSAPPSTVCPNNEATFTASGAGDGGSYCFTYECAECVHNPFLTGKEVPPAAHCLWSSECEPGTADTYSVVMPDAGNMTVWVKAITEHSCESSASTAVAIIAVPAITAVSSPAIYYGATAALSATASHVTNPATYTWNVEGYSETWTDTNTYTTPALTATVNYTVQITNNTGCPSTVPPAVSGRITVCDAFDAGSISSDTQTICKDANVPTIGSDQEPSGGGDGNYTYRWIHNGTNGTEVINENTATLTPTAYQHTPGTHTFTREVHPGCNPEGWVQSSNTWTLVVNDLPAGSPSSVVICAGNTATFSVSVTAEVTIDWYDALTGGNRVLEGQLSYTPDEPLTATTSYYAEAHNLITGCVSAERLQVTTIVTPTPELTVEGVPGLACVGDVLTLQASGAFAGSSYCFSVYVDDQLHSDCEYGEANTFTVTVPDEGTMTIRVQAKTIAGCEDDVLVHAPDMSSLDCINSAGVISSNSVTAILGYPPQVSIPTNEEEAATANPTYEWRRTGTSSVRLANSNTPAYTIADDIVAVYTAGTYYYHRWVYAGDPETSIALCADGSYTMVVVAPPPSPSGTTTWLNGTVIWTDAVRTATSCPTDQVIDKGVDYGLYYQGTCWANSYATICPAPWHNTGNTPRPLAEWFGQPGWLKQGQYNTSTTMNNTDYIIWWWGTNNAQCNNWTGGSSHTYATGCANTWKQARCIADYTY